MNYRLDFDFTTEEDLDIKRCLINLYGTRAGSQPMDRNFGMNYDSIVGMPPEVAKNMLALEIIIKTQMYEPRVTVESVDFTVDSENGQLMPIIHILKGDESNEQYA